MQFINMNQNVLSGAIADGWNGFEDSLEDFPFSDFNPFTDPSRGHWSRYPTYKFEERDATIAAGNLWQL